MFVPAGYLRHALLASLCFVLTLTIVGELGEADALFATSSARASPGPSGVLSETPPAAEAAASFSLPPLQSFAVVSERPLFSPSRQPAPASNSESDAWSSFVLAGIVISPDLREAMVFHNQPPALVNLQEGDAIDGWTVTSIFPDRAVFRNGTAEHELKLNIAEKGKTAAAEGPSKSSSPSGPTAPPPRRFQ